MSAKKKNISTNKLTETESFLLSLENIILKKKKEEKGRTWKKNRTNNSKTHHLCYEAQSAANYHEYGSLEGA